MPRPTTAARRYAEAAFELASLDATHERWESDLRLAAEAMADERVADVVDNPAIPLANREEVIQRGDGGLARLAVTDDELALAAADRDQRVDCLDSRLDRGIDRLANDDAGRDVRMTADVDPELIGGLVVRVGDQLIDASVRGRLERLRDQLVAGTQNR